MRKIFYLILGLLWMVVHPSMAQALVSCAIVDTSTSPQIVTNVIQYPSDISGQVPPGMAAPLIAQCNGASAAGRGWNFTGGTFVNPNPAPATSVPFSVSRRQYYMQGAAQGWFTQAQALALIANGTLPPSVVSFVNSLPANQQFAANMYLIGEQRYGRNDPLLLSLTASGGLTSAQVDAFFIAASQL